MPTPIQVLRATWVIPIVQPPQRDGFVAIQDGRIVAVGRGEAPPGMTREFRGCALIPGLINAHTHLEFSDLEEPLASADGTFSSWLRQVLAYRQQRAVHQGALESAIERGLEECRARGTVAVGEIATAPWPKWASRIPRSVTFLEQLGLDPSAVQDRAQRVRQRLQELANPDGATGRHGISPHAPYSVHRDLFAELVRIARERSLPMAMHLAETPEELELLATGRGPLRELLDELQVWSAHRALLQVEEIIAALPGDQRHLLIHGNYFNEAQLDLIAKKSSTLSVVYCPRTHRYFQHSPYPLQALARRRINVAIGTDSRASNPNLDLWEELQWIRRSHPQLAPAEILRMGTVQGAWALGIEEICGSLQPGSLGTILRIDVGEPADETTLWERLFEGTAIGVGTT